MTPESFSHGAVDFDALAEGTIAMIAAEVTNTRSIVGEVHEDAGVRGAAPVPASRGPPARLPLDRPPATPTLPAPPVARSGEAAASQWSGRALTTAR